MKNLKLLLIAFSTVLLSGSFLSVKAHSVQIAYCVNCNGDLRIFVEHWHSSENPATTTMTIALTINNVTTTVTSPPGTGIMNTPINSLPGCVTQIISAAGCPGQANTYQDWVIYDYIGLPCGVPISFTIISGNTVFTTDGCGMYPLTVPFNIPCGAGILNDVNVCAGVLTAPIVVPIGTTWINSNPAIGLPASGVGDLPPFIPVGPSSATIYYISSCTNDSFVIFVNPSPTSSFSVNSASVCLGAANTFVNLSTANSNATWAWDFGDASNSSQQTPPSHTYASAGTYTVSLTVTDSLGCANTSTQIITVNPPPLVSFNTTSVCAGNAIQFNNTTTGGVTYNWDFGTGNSALQNPSFTFPGAGTYPVQLIVTSANGCIDSLTQNIIVDPIPVAAFTYTQFCNYGVANFTSTSTVVSPSTISTTTWNFGDPTSTPNNTSTSATPTHTFTAVGTYTVTLVVVTNSGCTHTTTQIITVSPPPTAAFTATTVCQNLATQFTNLSNNSLSYAWNFGSPAPNDTSSAMNPSYIFTSAGTFTVTLITNPGPCSDTASVAVTVMPSPQVAFTAPTVCFGTTTVFTDLSTVSSGTITGWFWNFGDPTTTADISNLQNPTYQYNTSGTFNVTLTCISSSGCMTVLTLPVYVNTLPVANFGSVSACMGLPVLLNDLSIPTTGVITNWVWNFGDNSPLSTQQNPSHVFPAVTTYTVTLIVTNSAGCIDTFNMPVLINANPDAAFTADTLAGCPAHCVNFLDQSTISTGSVNGWTWNFGDNSPVDNQQNPSHCYLLTGTYSVTLTVTSNNGCVNTQTMPNYITVFPNPVANFTANPFIAPFTNPTINFTDLSPGNPQVIAWQWDFGSGQYSTSQNPSNMYNGAGTYIVTLTVTDGNGCVDTAQSFVTITEGILVPNVFTPNGDGINDEFTLPNSGMSEYHIQIFDRWGVMVFESEDSQFHWNGYANNGDGKLCTSGTYYFVLRARSYVNVYDTKGFLTLINPGK